MNAHRGIMLVLSAIAVATGVGGAIAWANPSDRATAPAPVADAPGPGDHAEPAGPATSRDLPEPGDTPDLPGE